MVSRAVLAFGPRGDLQDVDRHILTDMMYVERIVPRTFQGRVSLLVSDPCKRFEKAMRRRIQPFSIENLLSVVGEAAPVLSTDDTFLLYMNAHGNTDDAGQGKRSYLGFSPNEYLDDRLVETLLSPLNCRQLVVIQGCRDGGFGNLANPSRLVFTSNPGFGHTEYFPQYERPASALFLQYVFAGHTYLDAFARTIEDLESDREITMKEGLTHTPRIFPRLHGRYEDQLARL